MAPKIFESTVYFQKRVRLDPDFVSVCLYEFGKLGFQFEHGEFVGHGVTWSVHGSEELAAESTPSYLEAIRLILFFRLRDDGQLAVQFDRVVESGPANVLAFPTFFRASSPEQALLYRLRAIRELLQDRFGDNEIPDQSRFTACSPEDTVHKQSAQDATAPPRISLNEQTPKSQTEGHPQTLPVKNSDPITTRENLRLWGIRPGWILSGLVAVTGVVALLPSFHQANSSDKQTNISEKNYLLEGQAYFTFHRRNATKESPDKGHSLETFSFENLGRGVARNVQMQCGDLTDRGPSLDLGSIGPKSSSTRDILLSSSPNDILHAADHLCWTSVFLEYDDEAGHHRITFDLAGNPREVAPSSR